MPFLSVIFEAVQRVIAFFDRRRALVVVLVAAAILAAGTSVRVFQRPPVLVPVVDAITGGVMTALSQPLKIGRLFTRSRGPSKRVMELELELARLREAERENARLRAMLGYEPPIRYRTVPARVVGLDRDPVRGVAWINVGSHHGVAPGEAVVTVEGLVGVVEKVSSRSSRIRLLRNENSPVSVRDTRSRVLGIVEWDPGEGKLHVTKVPLQSDVAAGDTLISSGLGGVFPPGLPVGTVAEVRDSPERLLKDILLDPFASFFRLEETFVLIPQAPPPGLELPGKLPGEAPADSGEVVR
jgi:rod shape-determining protein MreC